MVKSTRYELYAVYEVIKDFFIEVTIDHVEKTYNAFIFHARYGIKDYMFGLPMESIPNEEYLLEILIGNAPDYIKSYEEEFMD